MLLVGSATQADVGDYGVMWSNQLEGACGCTYNRFNMHGGALTDIGYVNDAWANDHVSSLWGKPDPYGPGSWINLYTQFDKYGNNVWTDFIINKDQSYGRALATNGNTVLVSGANRANIETEVAGERGA